MSSHAHQTCGAWRPYNCEHELLRGLTTNLAFVFADVGCGVSESHVARLKELTRHIAQHAIAQLSNATAMGNVICITSVYTLVLYMF